VNFDRYSDLISLLVLWHRLEDQTIVEGYPKECPSCREYITSTQYDWGGTASLYEDGSTSNGAGETRERAMMALVVGRTVEQMPEPYRSAVMVFARNRATGRNVWTSPRLPEDRDTRVVLLADALVMLAERV
jgi:hypothetical protein